MARIVDFVASHGESSSIGFGLLRADGAEKTPIRDISFSRLRCLVFSDESNGLVRLGDTTSYSIGESTKFVGRWPMKYSIPSCTRDVA